MKGSVDDAPLLILKPKSKKEKLERYEYLFMKSADLGKWGSGDKNKSKKKKSKKKKYKEVCYELFDEE